MPLALQVGHEVVLQLETGMVGSQVDTHGLESAISRPAGCAVGTGSSGQGGQDVRAATLPAPPPEAATFGPHAVD
ncbi:hypothetical protein GCM10017788_11410 [Amycolatopsis acidiphila]|nr:hypothetical protein GCM10017788_11410 [Amycolatopsis acidiphila]